MQIVEDCLKDSLHRVDVIEKNLATKLLTSERRERLEKELELVKEVLKKNETQLKNLRKENTKSFIIVGTIVFACYLIYGLYCMYYNTN